MGVFAGRDDLIARFEGELTERQLTFGEAKIVDAEALLMSLVPSLAAGPSGVSDLVRANAVRAVCAAVLRVIRNPAGVSYEVVGSFTTRYGDGAARGDLHFTDEELAAVRTRPRRVGVIGLAGPRWVS